MGILCDSQIRELIGIEPFEENVKRPGKISYGVSSYGYDLRVGRFSRFSPMSIRKSLIPRNFPSVRLLRSIATKPAPIMY